LIIGHHAYRPLTDISLRCFSNFIASQPYISLLASQIFHCQPGDISLPASLYFIASQLIFHCLPGDISLPASQYFIASQLIFHC
jgi:hypothetical protein